MKSKENEVQTDKYEMLKMKNKENEVQTNMKY